jgi:hypothetical protein
VKWNPRHPGFLTYGAKVTGRTPFSLPRTSVRREVRRPLSTVVWQILLVGGSAAVVGAAIAQLS